MIRAEQDHVVSGRDGTEMFATVTMPDATESRPVVLFLHGFKGFRNWGFLPLAAQEAAQRGMIAVRMDTSMNGMRGTNDRVVDVEAFAANTVTREVDDVHLMVRALRPLLGLRWNGTLHLIGHSRGGGVALVVARELLTMPPDEITVGRCAVWNGLGRWIRWTPRQRTQWMELGYTEFEHQRTGQMLRMNADYLLDIEANAERLDLQAAATVLADRMLYVHADQDVTVPVSETMALRTSAGTSGPMITVERTTHTFGMTHPTSRVTEAFTTVLHHTMDWIEGTA
jgi:uncharacterized protein